MGKNYLQNIQGILTKFLARCSTHPTSLACVASAKKGRGGEGRGDRGKREMGKGKGSISLSPSPQSLSLFPSFPSPLDACHVGQRGSAHTRLGFCWPFLLGVYCLYRHFVTDYLLTSVRKFGNNILQVLIFVIPGEK